MAKSTRPMEGPRAVPERDARKIVVECRRCLDEDADQLGPSTRMRMLAIQRAIEATADLTGGFPLEAINDQISQIAHGAEKLAPAVVKAARRADQTATKEHRRSFFTSYISGKSSDAKRRRFNSYVRAACKRLGLNYVAVIGGSPDGQYGYYYLKHSRDEAEPREKPRDHEQLAAIIAESAALLARRGWGADEVGQMYRSARAVAEKIMVCDDSALERLRFEVAIGLWSHHLVRSDMKTASAEVARLLEIAARHADLSMRVVALRASGTTALWLGRFVDAERELRQCLRELGDGSGYTPFESDLGASPFSLVSSDLAATLVVLGRHEEALEINRSTREYLAGKNDPFHDCYSLTLSSWIKLELRELASAAADASDLVRKASQYQLAALRGLGTALEGIIRTFLAEDPGDGIGDLYRGLGEWQFSGTSLLVSFLFTQVARAWLQSGNTRQAELAVQRAFEVAEKTGIAFYTAEMHRLRAEIKWTRHKDFAGAEADLLEALEITEAQQARTFRLRAATSLVRMAHDRDDLSPTRKGREIAQGLKLLHEACTSFAHEPDFADIRAARTLIVEMEKPRRPSRANEIQNASRRSPGRTQRKT
jgi:tetratricopeptide (TPR) repeat protein